jgi:hypothetical protein
VNHDWKWLRSDESRFDKILERLLREASECIPGLSPDPKQADPVVVMLLRSFAREYALLYGELDDAVGMGYRALVSQLIAFPHAPEPASTVLRLEVKDPGTRVPVEFQAEAPQPIALPGRRAAQARFSPTREGKTSAFEVAARVLVDTAGDATLLPDKPGAPASARWKARSRASAALFVALDALAPRPDDRAELFVYGDPAGVRSLLWSAWDVPAAAGGASRGIHAELSEPPYVPAQEFHRITPYQPPVFTFRSDTRRVESPYDWQIVPVGGSSLLSQACAHPQELGDAPSGLPPAHGTRHWIRIVLPPETNLAAVMGAQLRTNAVVAINRARRSSGRVNLVNTPVHSWTLPDDVSFDNLLSVDNVVDFRTGDSFKDANRPEGLDAPRSYRLVEWADGERKRLRIELLNRATPAQISEVQVDFSVTLGAAANDLGAGTVTVAFTPADVFPGLVSVTNLVPTMGGRPARTPDLQEEDLRHALRARGRAVVAGDYVEMARAFDPERVGEVRIARGVTRGPRGLRSSIVVEAATTGEGFVNELERESFQRRLTSYLQDHCPVGETIDVQLVDSLA